VGGFPGFIFFVSSVWYKTHYIIVRTPFAHQPERKGGQPVGTWLSADLDSIICDFMDQLRSATEQGWHRTKPDHYRAILAALESALKERRGSSAAPTSAVAHQSAPSWPASNQVEAMLPVVLRRSWWPLLAFVPSRSH
jgi:hypothetical protein